MKTTPSPHSRARSWCRIAPFLLVMVQGLGCMSRAARPDAPESRHAPLVRVEYGEPANPSHREIFAEMRDRHVLERFAELLEAIQLPKPLTLAFASCDGVSNAWYDPDTGTVTFCYEFLADIRRAAATHDLGKVPAQDAMDGPIAFVLLHETGHAVFDLLKVPILGREEDAADTFATFFLLRLGHDVALRMLRGAAWNYAQEARLAKPEESDFADVHGLNAQRYYNIMCLAYGSDPQFFGAVVTGGYLPADRAEGCSDEYQQALFAMQKLVAPAISPTAVERLRVKHGRRWEQGL